MAKGLNGEVYVLALPNMRCGRDRVGDGEEDWRSFVWGVDVETPENCIQRETEPMIGCVKYVLGSPLAILHFSQE